MFRGKAQLALMEPFLNVVDIHHAVAVEDHQIVLVPLVVAEKEVLAMLGIVTGPILLGNLNGRCLGMFKVLKINAQLFQQFVQARISVHGYLLLRPKISNAKERTLKARGMWLTTEVTVRATFGTKLQKL